MFFLSDKLWFPSVEEANDEGLLALGGDLSAERLILAYKSGIFPWYNEDETILWWSPDPRMVLFPEEIKVSKSMRKVINQNEFNFTENHNFKFVLDSCSEIKRANQQGTWLSREMKQAYLELYHLGYAKSVEAWQDNKIVGGFYGVTFNNIFSGESMFSQVSNASKAALIYFAKKYSHKIKLIDCQVYTKHLETLGAKEIKRTGFIEILNSVKN